MDNRTIVIMLNLTLLITAVFTVMATTKKEDPGHRDWRISSICAFTGFLLLSLQSYVSIFISIIISNYLILMSSFFQILSASEIEYGKKRISLYYALISSCAYMTGFLYFTYGQFNTPARIIIISVMLAANFTYGALLLTEHKSSPVSRLRTRNKSLFALFAVSAVFYTARVLFTYRESMGLTSLYQKNLTTSFSFIYHMTYQISFTLGMFWASLHGKTVKLTMEKEKLRNLFSFLNSTAPYLDLKELYPKIKEILKDTMHIDAGGIFLSDGTGSNYTMVYTLHDTTESQPLSFKAGTGVTGKAIEINDIVETDINNYPESALSEQFKKHGVKHIAAVPIRASGNILGAITIIYTSHEKTSFMDKEFFTYLGEQMGIVMQNALLHHQVKSNANTDPLTGLLNRRRMIEIMVEEEKIYKRYTDSFCIAIADLDFFKSVNDTYGHDCGDRLLMSVSEIFRKCSRDTDYISRWGGEEFLFLFTRTDLAGAVEILTRIKNGVKSAECKCTENNFKSTVSFGVTQYIKDEKIEKTITRADRALYSAKENGRDSIVSL